MEAAIPFDLILLSLALIYRALNCFARLFLKKSKSTLLRLILLCFVKVCLSVLGCIKHFTGLATTCINLIKFPTKLNALMRNPSPMGSAVDSWAETLNPGHVAVLNPALFKSVMLATEYLASQLKHKIALIEVGAGKNCLLRELLKADPSVNPSWNLMLELNLVTMEDIRRFRGRVVRAIGFESEAKFLDEGYRDDLIDLEPFCLGKDHLDAAISSYPATPFPLVISRQVYPHLSDVALTHHFNDSVNFFNQQEIQGVLIATRLHSDYHRWRIQSLNSAPDTLEEGQMAWCPLHENHRVRHCFRTETYFARLAGRAKLCNNSGPWTLTPRTEAFRESHERYYNPDRPMGSLHFLSPVRPHPAFEGFSL